MSNKLLRRKVIKLRRNGFTYSEIRRKLGVPKSTLSEWLSKFPLTSKEIKKLSNSIKKSKDIAIEKCRFTKQKKHELRLKNFYEEEKQNLLPMTKKELLVSGLMLYWGEGSKGLKGAINLNNTDPKVLKFYLYWLTKIINIPRNKIKVTVHLYSDMDIEHSLNYWSTELKIPRSQFTRPYIKLSKKADIDQKGFGHGTCGLSISNVLLKERIIMGIEAIADHYGRKI